MKSSYHLNTTGIEIKYVLAKVPKYEFELINESIRQ